MLLLANLNSFIQDVPWVTNGGIQIWEDCQTEIMQDHKLSRSLRIENVVDGRLALKEVHPIDKAMLTSNIWSNTCVKIFIHQVQVEFSWLGLNIKWASMPNPPPVSHPSKKEGRNKVSVRENKVFFPGRVAIISRGLDNARHRYL